EVLIAQGTDGADIDDVARQFVVTGLAGEDVDFGVAAPVDDLKFTRATNFAGEADATGAHDATSGEQRDVFAEVVLIGLLQFRLAQPGVPAPIAEAKILQFTLTCLIARRTIERVV